LSTVIVILAGVFQVVTGLATWKPIQFSGLVSLLGGFRTARVLHFAGMAVIVGFLIVHLALALLVPKTLWAMVAGGPHIAADDRTRGASVSKAQRRLRCCRHPRRC
jgi:thiosulfate reductase cytochrome b subunit